MILDFVFDGIAACVRAIGGLVRSAPLEPVLDGESNRVGRGGGWVSRRRARRRFRELVRVEGPESLRAVYLQMGDRDTLLVDRLDALIVLSESSITLATPLLRDAIERMVDPMLTFTALAEVGDRRIVALRRVVERARDDHRPLIAETARLTHVKLLRESGQDSTEENEGDCDVR